MLQWALDNGEIDLGLEVGAALWRWWLTSGRLSAGRAWLGKFLTAAGERPVRTAEGSQRIGRALCAAAVLAAEIGDYAEAVRQARQAMHVFEPLGPGEDLAFAATVLGSPHWPPTSPSSRASSCAARATSRPTSRTGSRRPSATPTPSPPPGSAAIPTT